MEEREARAPAGGRTNASHRAERRRRPRRFPARGAAGIGRGARARALRARGAYWGRRWFLVPNPMYGSWLVALGPSLDAAVAAEPGVLAACPAP